MRDSWQRPQSTQETQKKMFEAADVDKSGSISFEEFVACLMSFALDPPEAHADMLSMVDA